MLREKSILVTGAAGFIGSHLAEVLLNQGNEVVGVDNFITGSRENIDHLQSVYPKFTFLERDISQPLDVDEELDYIFHFACPASPADFERLRFNILTTGCFGTFYLLQLAQSKEATFVFASSSEVYGDPEQHPQREKYRGNVNTTGPRAVYDESKRYGETMLTVFHDEFGLDTRMVRIFNTYGERMRLHDGRAIPAFITQALLDEDLTVFGDGSQTRSIQYISDLIGGVLLLAESDVIEPVNIGNPQEITMKLLAEEIIILSKSKSKIVYRPLPKDDPKRRQPDISTAKQLLDWEPRVMPEEGLLRTIDWFRRKLKR
ncbi:MAG: GDP-mannose 4,6-dehydratase [Candidatus Chisholmbacteria bacterium]|nr:GDP-mannose 4,6-dehydratase [Candidatus Chisholmbacteria bacterium]